MKVNLLQGTCTPTLTLLPGVHMALEPTAYSVRSCLAPASDGGSPLALFKHSLTPGKVTVPGKMSDDLPPGTFKSILRQAGLESQV